MPSAFTRKAPPVNNPLPPGTIPSPSASSLPILSTGIPSLDDVLGSGQPLNSILSVLAPDTHSSWGKLIARYYIAQGLALDQDVLVIGGADREELDDLVKGCMWLEESAKKVSKAVIEANMKEEDDSDAEGLAPELDAGNRTRIAWRYDKMKKFETSVAGSSGSSGGTPFHLPLNLTTPIPKPVLSSFIESSQLRFLPLSEISEGSSAYSIFSSILERVRSSMYPQNGQRKKVLRIVVYDIGGREWGDGVSSAHIHRFLHSLRYLLRESPAGKSSSPASVLCTFPASLSSAAPSGKGKGRVQDMSTEAWLKSVMIASDACIELQGFASDPALVHSFPHSHGLVQVHSLPSLHTLVPPSYKHSTLLGLGSGSTGQNNLSFRLKRKRFVIETLHLGVEGGVGERRTEPPPSMQQHVHGEGCGHSGVEEAGVRFAAMGVEVEKGNEVKVGDESRVEPVEKKEKRKVAFVRHDKPELYEF